MRELGFAGIIFIAFCIALIARMRRLQVAGRIAEADDMAFRWERLRERIHTLLDNLQGTTVVLVTGFRVADEAAGQSLRQYLQALWSDRVELSWQADRPSDAHWCVVTTSETVSVSPILERQWLTRMRTVCYTYDCKVSSLSVLTADGPPTVASVNGIA